MVLVNYISVALSSFCIIILLLVFTCLMAGRDRFSKLNRIFSTLVICIIVLISSDIVAWLMTGNTQIYAFYLIRAANFLHYAFGTLSLAAMTLYIFAYLELKTNIPANLRIAALSLCALSLILTIISQFNGMYYTIDEFSTYHRGELFWLSQILPMAGMLINMGIVLFYRKVFENKFLFLSLAYIIVPISALCISLLYYGITFINITSTLSMLILYISIQIEHSHNMSSHIKIMNNQLVLQEDHYKAIQSYIVETKRAEHDLRQHLSVIQSFNAARDNENLDVYLSKYIESLPGNTEITYCENFAVNSILLYYAGIAKKDGIQVVIDVEVPKDTGIHDSDLCIIFGNCIENAIEACRRVVPEKSNGDRFIKVRSKMKGKMLTIVFANSLFGDIKKEGDNYLSLKHEGEGIGISSVKAVVEKYGQTVKFETDDSEFHVTIILRAELG